MEVKVAGARALPGQNNNEPIKVTIYYYRCHKKKLSPNVYFADTRKYQLTASKSFIPFAASVQCGNGYGVVAFLASFSLSTES